MLRLVSIAAVFAVLLSGCGSSPSVDDQPSLTEQMAEILKTIKDADSAKSAAPKLEALAEKIHALQKEGLNGAAPSDPDKFRERQLAALELYGQELTRVSSLPGAPQHLQGMIKKMTPDGGMAAAFNSRVAQTLSDVPPRDVKPGDLNPRQAGGVAANRASGARTVENANKLPSNVNAPAAASSAVASPAAAQPAAPPAITKLDLRPDPNFNGQVPEKSVPAELSKWFSTAKKGDFVELEEVHSDGRQSLSFWERHEVLDVDGEWVVIASVHQTGSHKHENRVRMRVAVNAPWPPAPPWPPKPLGAQTIAAAGRQFACQGVKHGGVTSWCCDEVPYNQVVKEERSSVYKILTAYGRGAGLSPIVPAFVTANKKAPSASPPQAQEARSASPAPPATSRAPAGPQGADAAHKIEELQTSIEGCQQEIERSNKELKKAEATAEDLEKKLKRLAIASNKSKRGKGAKGEFERELNRVRSEISDLKREIKKNEERLSKAEKELKKYQGQGPDKP